MGILQEVGEEKNWLALLEQCRNSKYVGPTMLAHMEAFVQEERYRKVTDHIAREGYEFPLPRKIMISKMDTAKKRIAYIFPEEEMMVLKMINRLLFRYDHKLSSACYSFRMGRSVKDVVRKIDCIPGLINKYTLKLDLSNFSNSIPKDKLLEATRQVIDDDPQLVAFLERLIGRSQAIFRGRQVMEPMGAMTGIPIVGFLDNLYLRDVDDYFVSRGIPYFRYGDDILLFLDSREQQQRSLECLTRMLVEEKGLILNPEKVRMTAPGEKWDYLGFSYQNGHYDLAANTVEKAKGRIRRYARRLYREKRQRLCMSYEETVALFLRRFNKMFFGADKNNELAWNRWYFSVITTSKSLKMVDAYMQQYIRYLYSGRHYKGNYKITYKKIKEMGYRSLVHEYYQYLKTPAEHQEGEP